MVRLHKPAVAIAVYKCLVCRSPILKRPYFHTDDGWCCGQCLDHYSIQELQTLIGRSQLHGQLYC